MAEEQTTLDREAALKASLDDILKTLKQTPFSRSDFIATGPLTPTLEQKFVDLEKLLDSLGQ